MELEDLKSSVEGIAQKMVAMDKSEEITALTEKCAAMEDAIRRLSQRAPETNEKKEEMTFGQEFIKSDSFAAFAAGTSRKAYFEKTTAVLGNAGTKDRADVVGTKIGGAALSLADALGTKPTASSIIEYPQETAWTNSAAAVLEAGEKPESAVEFTLVQAPVQVIAHYIPVTKQLIADTPALAAYIDGRMEDGLRQKTEDEILNGTGIAPRLKGFLSAGNYTAHGLSQGSGETNLDLIRKCAQAVRVSGFNPNVVILNPSDYDAITATKATDGHYLMVNPVAGGTVNIWGLTVLQSSKIAQGTFLVGDLSQADLFERQSITLEMFEQDSDNVRKNLVTIRAERRCALAVYSPIAFVGGSLW